MLVHHMYTTLCSYWRRPLTAGIAANGFRSGYVSKISVHTVPLHLNLVHIPLSLLPFPVLSLHSPLSSPPPICTCTTFSLPPSSLLPPPSPTLQVKGVMVQNIEKVTQRGEKLEDLGERAGQPPTITYIPLF